MFQRSFITPGGCVVITGDFSGDGPLLLVIRGAYADEDQLSRLPDHVSAPVVFADIPGHRSPWLHDQTIATCAAAFSTVLDELSRPTVVCGVSLGGLIALAMRGPNLRGVMALDPPLRPAETPHMRKAAASAFARSDSEAERAFLHSAFGTRTEGIERRDHFSLLDGLACPAIVLAGDDFGDVPSVLDRGSLQRLATLGTVTTRHVTGVGHAVWRGGSHEIVAAARELLDGAHDHDENAACAASAAGSSSLRRASATTRG